MLRVRYIGPGEAILAGTYIQSGEDREVSAAQLAAAQIDHPEGFVVLDEPPAPTEALSLNEPAPPPTALGLSDGGTVSVPAILITTPPAKPQPQQKRRH